MILSFGDPAAMQLSNSGGKGASLAKLFQGGFNVPPGVIVPASAYTEFIGDFDFGSLDYSDPVKLRDQCAALRAKLAALPMPAELERELREQIAPLMERGAVAVRSSSTMEDLAGAAFAGQHDTFLGVRGADSVVDAVRRCFASLWEDRAAHYRHSRGFDPAKATMAVVIQALVDSDVAGVAFTMNPITGSNSELVINASYGLGETVVSGAGDVDQFVIDRKTGEIRERTIGEKEQMIVATEGGGTREVELTAEQRGASSLDDQQLDHLRALLIRIERFYAFPQDVEWAFAGGDLYLLQSRPVTKFPPKWTRGESAERFPNVVTPLTWDYVVEGFHESLAHSLDLMGMPAFEGHWFELFDSYVYGNENAVKLFTSGQQVAFDSLDSLRALLPVIRERYQWVVQLPVSWARDLDYYLLNLGALGAADLERMNEEQLWRHVAAINRAGSDYFLPNIAISITHGILHRMLYGLVTLVVGPQEAPALYDSLTCFCDTKTNLVNLDIHRLAALVRTIPALRDLLSRMPRRRIWEEGKLRAFPSFLRELDRFLANHGHREVDFDTYHATWVGQPWVVLENVRLIAERGDLPDPSAREIELRERQQNGERRFSELVPEDLRYFALELVRLARAYTALDDLEHYQTTRLSIPFRAAIVELGRRLVDGRVLTEPEDIFFIRKATIDLYIAGDIDVAAVTKEATTNKDAYLANKARTPSWSLGDEADAAPLPGDALRGLPGSPGVAAGPVFRLHGVDDFGRFPPGSVLVARTTNPAWTPLFHSSVAVITESGGPLSHGAVTAREVGIPAVMAVRGALSLLDDGEIVRVNGSNGTVTRTTSS
ncbi:MAG: rifampicin phosphotransferase [Acidobacteriota bacterium]|jgi:pyruvate,water dikinase|nr:rifampicin phosphotransferase [Acidobacteriota bacterium]